jgi:hypothetical protein
MCTYIFKTQRFADVSGTKFWTRQYYFRTRRRTRPSSAGARAAPRARSPWPRGPLPSEEGTTYKVGGTFPERQGQNLAVTVDMCLTRSTAEGTKKMS